MRPRGQGVHERAVTERSPVGLGEVSLLPSAAGGLCGERSSGTDTLGKSVAQYHSQRKSKYNYVLYGRQFHLTLPLAPPPTS